MTDDAPIHWFYNEFSESVSGEIAGLFRKRTVSRGPACEELESKICALSNAKYCLTVTSGSVALFISAMILAQPNDEVIVQARTWIATANAFLMRGCSVKVVDMAPDGKYIDLEALEKSISARTKVVVVTHMNGRVANLDKVKSICSKHGISLVEDSAQALGSQYNGTPVGAVGAAGVFSFSVPKIVSGGQGGVIVTNEEDVFKRAKAFLIHGLGNVIDVERWEYPGFNFRYNDIQAKIVLSQIAQIDSRIQRIKDVQSAYVSALDGLPIKILTNLGNEVGPYIEAAVDNRTEFMNFLRLNHVETRPFYPSLSEADFLEGPPCPIAEKLSREGVYLPSGPCIPMPIVQRTAETIRRFYK